MLYLFGFYGNLRTEAGLEGLFALRFALFTLRVVLANNRSVLTDGRLEVVIGKRRVAILESVLECRQISDISTTMVLMRVHISC